MKYKITWQFGETEIIEGDNFDDAVRKSGRDPHDIAGMNYYIQLPVKYKCPECGWTGYENDMNFAECPAYYDRDEWTHKCSNCQWVGTLDEFEVVEE